MESTESTSTASSSTLTSTSSSTPTNSARWVRRDLALPNELLHKVILWVICNSVHSICVSMEDTTWEKNVIDTLHQVSPTFKAISSEIAVKAFKIRVDDASLLRTLRQIFVYLHLLGMKLRHPHAWGSVSFQTIDFTDYPLVTAYALYLSCISLRRNVIRSPKHLFESTHEAILSALTQSETLCGKVFPVEVTWLLKDSINDELILSRHGLVIVQAFHELEQQANNMAILQPCKLEDGTGPLAGVRSLMHTSLAKFEAVYDEYSRVRSSRSGPEPRIYELPGVLQALRKVHALEYDEDDYNLQKRVQRFVDQWKVHCPFLEQSAASLTDVEAVTSLNRGNSYVASWTRTVAASASLTQHV